MPTNTVTVAGLPLTDYAAHMQANPVISHTRDVETFQGRQRSTMMPIKNLITGMRLKAKIDFFGTASARAMNRSNFEALFRSQTTPVEIDVCDGFFYRAVLLSSTDCGTVFDLINTVEYVWQVTRHQTEVTIGSSSSHSLSFNCSSNVDRTDCCIEINQAYQQGTESISVEMNGLEWWIYHKDNPNNEKIVLDGINKTFLIGTKNAVNLIEWEDFPFLYPGSNTMEVFVDGAPFSNAPVTIRYTPTFL